MCHISRNWSYGDGQFNILSTVPRDLYWFVFNVDLVGSKININYQGTDRD